MANLGAIASIINDTADGDLSQSAVPQWWSDGAYGSPYGAAAGAHLCEDDVLLCPNGRLYGIAEIASVATVGHWVYLYDRARRQIVRKQRTAAGGAFDFRGLSLDAERYCVFISDEGDAGSYQATALDRLTAESYG